MSQQVDQAIHQAKALALDHIATRAKHDLFYLCHNILGYELMTENTHGQLCHYVESIIKPHSSEALQKYALKGDINASPSTHTKNLGEPDYTEVGKSSEYDDKYDQRIKNYLLLLPRGTFKSSVVTIGESIQLLLNDPDARILIDSETFTKAKAFLMEIKGHLESNEKLRDIYKHLFGMYPDANQKSDVWSDSALNLAARKRRRKEPSLSCAGVDVTKNGMHYDLIIMDDLVSENNTQNKEQLEKVIMHYRLAISLLDPHCPLIVIGTRWHFLDLYQHILDNEADDFNIMVRSAYKPDGSLFFPERLDEPFLTKTRQRQGSEIFSYQYLNEPVDSENATFKASNIQLVDWNQIKDTPINWYCLVDPSFKGPYSDFAALVVAGMDYQRQLYVRYVCRQKMTYGEIIDKMFWIKHEFPIKMFGLETVATQKSIMYDLKEQERIRGDWMPLKEFSSRENTKEERIKGLAPIYENRRIFHVKECPQREELEYELLTFPRSKHDDCIDALANILEMAQPAGGNVDPEKKARKRRRLEILTKPRSEMMGT